MFRASLARGFIRFPGGSRRTCGIAAFDGRIEGEPAASQQQPAIDELMNDNQQQDKPEGIQQAAGQYGRCLLYTSDAADDYFWV